jgi:hypothetical protein
MRGYVEALENAQYSNPNAGYDEVMDSYYEAIDTARDNEKYEETEEDD